MEQERSKVSVLFMLFGTLFCVCLITANVLETKQLSFGPVNLTAGIIVFPVSYIINDVVCEVWGYQRTRMLIWMGFAMNFLFVIFGAIADWIPGAPYWHGEEGFHVIFGLAPPVDPALLNRSSRSAVPPSVRAMHSMQSLSTSYSGELSQSHSVGS